MPTWFTGKNYGNDRKLAQSQNSVGLLVPSVPGREAAMNVAPIYSGQYRLSLGYLGLSMEPGKNRTYRGPGCRDSRPRRRQAAGRWSAAATVYRSFPETDDL